MIDYSFDLMVILIARSAFARHCLLRHFIFMPRCLPRLTAFTLQVIFSRGGAEYFSGF